MAIIRQPAYIAKSPISIEIGGTVTPYPAIEILPARDIQLDGELIGTGRGKWITSFRNNSNAGPTSFTFSDLEGVSSDFFTVTLPTTLTQVSAPNLFFIGQTCMRTISTPLTTLNLQNLKMCGGTLFGDNVQAATFTALTSFPCPSLMQVGSFRANFQSVTGSVDLSKLKYVTGLLDLTLGAATSVNLSSFVAYFGFESFSLKGSSLTTITLPPLGGWKVLGGSFSSTSNTLNQSSVDNILAALAYMDGTNGTTPYGSGKTVTITGSSLSPSNLGSTTTAGSNFVGAGTTCTVNWTNHGYATGDVLRISGITTLTNANIYARITVVNANQFTYTITSQTAIGAGTATVVKAGNSAKALVTRGVTLTTN